MAPGIVQIWLESTGLPVPLVSALAVAAGGLLTLRLLRTRTRWLTSRSLTRPQVSRGDTARPIVPLRPDISDESGRRPALSTVLGGRRRNPECNVDVLVGIMDEIRTNGNLGELMQSVADQAAEAFGFNRVIVRLFNARTRLFEARAFHGCSPDVLSHLSTVDVRQEAWTALLSRGRAVGETLRVKSNDPSWPDRFVVREKRVVDEDEWSLDNIGDVGLTRNLGPELVIIPLGGFNEAPTGYICAEPRPDADFEDEARLGQLRVLARLIVAEIGRCQLRGTLERRDVEYAIVSEQLQEWQSMRDNFVANISHELRTPLTSIKAYAETLQRAAEDLDASTSKGFVEVIMQEADRLNAVFDDLIDVAHMESRGRRIARDRLDLKAMVHATATEYRAHFNDRSVDLRVFAPDKALSVQGDAEGLQQVIDNLLSNASKFTPPGGTVRVELREELGTAYLTVEDDGVGIPEKELERIFERFYQIDGTATRSYGGQGLGLAISRDIVEWHHGRIWAERRDGKGSRFVVALPVRGFVVRPGSADEMIDANERLQWESFLQLSIHLVSDMLGTRVASIMLVDDSADLLRIEAAVGLDAEVVQGTTLSCGQGVAGLVWQDDATILVPDLDEDPRFRGLAKDVTYSPRSLLSVPMRYEGRVVGVLNVNAKFNGQPFDRDDALLLEALAERIVVSIESFEGYRQSYRRLSSVEHGVRALLDLGRERSGRIKDLLCRAGMEAGRLLDLDEEHLRSLAYALRTYDLGLTSVSRHILRKASPLTEAEREELDGHAKLGSELIADLESSPRVRRMILSHHENFDGSGYPAGLSGEAIPVGARIVRLVDTLSSLLVDRPFRSALSLDDALTVLESEAGTTYCPRVTPVFLHVLTKAREELHEVLRPVEVQAPAELLLQGSPDESL